MNTKNTASPSNKGPDRAFERWSRKKQRRLLTVQQTVAKLVLLAIISRIKSNESKSQ